MKIEQHPLAKSLRDRWLMMKDFSKGGIAVTSPDEYHILQSSLSPIWNRTDGTEDGDRTFVGWGLQAFDDYSYLVRFPSEMESEFDQRKRRAFHIQLLAHALKILVDSAMKAPPHREFEDQMFTNLAMNATGNGVSIDHLLKGAVKHALLFNRCHLLVDVSSPPRFASLYSLNDLIYYNIKPIVKSFTPLDLYDWCLDDDGNFQWVVFSQYVDKQRSLGEKSELVHQLSYWDSSEWIKYEAAPKQNPSVDDDYIEVARGKNVCGKVPVYTVWGSEEREFKAEGPLASLADTDREIFNLLSELQHLTSVSSFSTLLVPAKMPGALTVAPARAIGVTEDAAVEPKYISPEAAHALNLWNRIKELYSLSKESLVAFGGGEDDGRTELRSADMVIEKRSTRLDTLRDIAVCAESAENEIYKLAGMWFEKDAPIVSREKDLSRRSLERQVEIVEKLSSLPQPPKEIDQLMAIVGERALKEFK